MPCPVKIFRNASNEKTFVEDESTVWKRSYNKSSCSDGDSTKDKNAKINCNTLVFLFLGTVQLAYNYYLSAEVRQLHLDIIVLKENVRLSNSENLKHVNVNQVIRYETLQRNQCTSMYILFLEFEAFMTTNQ